MLPKKPGPKARRCAICAKKARMQVQKYAKVREEDKVKEALYHSVKGFYEDLQDKHGKIRRLPPSELDGEFHAPGEGAIPDSKGRG